MVFGFEIVVMLVMMALNAVFAAYEMALASISRTKLMALVNLKRKGAAEGMYMKDRMEGSLAVVQLGITLAGAIAAAIGGAGVDEYLSPLLKSNFQMADWVADTLSLVLLIIPLSVFTIIFAELIPKTYAIHHQVRVCLVLSPLMKVLSHLAYPAITVLERIVKKAMHMAEHRHGKEKEDTGLHELNAAVAVARTSRLLGPQQEKILLSAAQLSVRPVKEIMIPIRDVSMIPLSGSLTEALIQAHNDMHTRFPVCASDGHIEGYVNFKDIVAGLKINPADPSIKGILRPIKSVLSSTVISQVLEKMIFEKLHIAIVIGAEGGPAIGMVTLEDIIEEMVGEIEDEFDRTPGYIHPYGSGWLMGGGVTMAAFEAAVGRKMFTPEEEKMKLAEWFSQKKKGPLKGGELVVYEDLHIIARKLRRKKLGEAVVSIVS